jgi:hydroxymethylpyrimidine/phosphomethylpyrimidine kinase
MPTVVLTIGTTHPWNVAGVGRDLAVGREWGCSVVTAVAAVSAQNSRGVRAFRALPGALLRAQLDSLEEAMPGAIRVGALGSTPNVVVVSDLLRAKSLPAVVDPVMRASAGGSLADPATVAAMRDLIATLPNVILTPNLEEAIALLDGERVENPTRAAMRLQARGLRAVLLKGGDAEGDPTDVLVTADGVESFTAPRIHAAMSGKGCTLAMAIACSLAHGNDLRAAVVAAREFLRAKMAALPQRKAQPV